MIRPEEKEGIKILTGINPFAKDIIEADSLVLGSRFTKKRILTDNRLDFSNVHRDPRKRDRIVRGLAQAIETSKPEAVSGIGVFGDNFGPRIAAELEVPFFRTNSSANGDKQRVFFPADRRSRDVLAETGRIAVIAGFCDTKQTLLDFIESPGVGGLVAGIGVVWRRGHPSKEVELPTDLLPGYLIDHPIPEFITSQRS